MWRRFAAPLAPLAPVVVFCDEKNTQFWEDKWRKFGNAKPGWHLNDINEALRSNEARFGITPQSRVLVPLCGKSQDLIYLMEKSKEVVGVECVQKAMDEFSTEHRFVWSVDGVPEFERATAYDGSRPGRYFGKGPKGLGYYLDPEQSSYHSFVHENLTILKADIFEERLPTVDRIYDRAALVAIHPSQRLRYVDKLNESLQSGGKILLITLDSDVERVCGPPHPISEATVRELFPTHTWNVEFVSRTASMPHPSPIRKTDQVSTDELQFIITKKGGLPENVVPYVAAAGGVLGVGAIALIVSKFRNRNS